MTVSSTSNRITYDGNGSLKVFAYTFRVLDEDEVLVQIKDTNNTITTQTITTDYTVSGVGDAAGGNITFVTAPASTDTVILTRNISFLQSTDYTENAALPAETLEQDFDKSVMRDQQLQEQLNRSLYIDADLAETFSSELPEPTANYLLAVNSTKTAFTFVTTTNGAVIDSGAVTGDLTITSGDLIMFDGFAINDDNDNEVIEIAKTASAVNHIKVTNAATGNASKIEGAGDDTNIDLGLGGKGSGTVNLLTDMDVNGQKIVSSSNGNIDIEPNGTGNVLLGNFTLDADQTVNSATDNYVFKYDNSTGLISLEAPGAEWTEVTSTTASSDASIEFTSLTAYSEYKFQFEAMDPVTDGVFFRATVSVDNGTSYLSTGYGYSYSSTVGETPQEGTFWTLHAASQGNAAEELYGFMILSRNTEGSEYPAYTGGIMHEGTASGDEGNTIAGINTAASTSDVDAIKFMYSSGNINSGTIRVFGR
jgi:hypothetical protein